VDDKWSWFFAEKVPVLQKHIAGLLGTGQPGQIVFAPNTHELLFRVISGYDLSVPLKIVTTDSEFHSFTRQVNRLDELSNVQVVRVPTLPFEDFTERFCEAVQSHKPDMVFVSQVFFNSGLVVEDLSKIIHSVSDPDTIIMVDGYHAFTAIPVDISAFRNRIFYLAGGYKYAQGGEGCCFMHVPKGYLNRPLYTGWYAEFGELQKFKSRKVDYSKNGFHFAGSTMDYSPLYRQLAVFELWKSEGVTISDVHQHVQSLQKVFLEQLAELKQEILTADNLMMHNMDRHGHFLTFELQDSDKTEGVYQHLKQNKIMTDYRGSRLRFGFAPYHEAIGIDLSCLEQF
jgi:selenocysteine lyase/cysteine desulfurase